ncbi:hypothetical protein K1T71_014402 [Dendrolimus kikuchii]|uniref:Uncharacterized protein n=1 Tax=Dendrolimus kikuchii TaxID=765133 RepID=A0ACC1CE25_9NEOP|nr:hypothetical protein K1T71_014402 [Dendrolimus kikuchii]
MFNFFKRKPGKPEGSAEDLRRCPNESSNLATVDSRPREEKSSKDVVNLLIPETDYNQNQKTGVGAILDIMAGKRRKSKRRNTKNSFREIETKLPRNNTDSRDVQPPTHVKNKSNVESNEAEFVRGLVMQKYAKPQDKQHVSLVYLSPEEDKKQTEVLLKEIARTIDSTVDKINEAKLMGVNDSKLKGSIYESVDGIDEYKNELKDELDKLLNTNEIERNEAESPSVVKKSNLKVPKLELDVSDDDRSDNGKKKVTFQKHIIFDDGEQQTDEEVDSSFESLTSEDEDDENKTVIKLNDEQVKRLISDNSDSGFLDENSGEVDVTSARNVESESECEEEIIEEIIEEYVEDSSPEDDQKTLVTQDSKFQSQVAALSELAASRNEEADRARELITSYRKEIETKDQEIEQLKCEIAAAYKESELIRQRSRSLEEELAAARSCSADLAEQLQRRNDELLRQLRAEVEDSNARRAELESKVLALERDKERLEQERAVQEQKAREALAASEANTAKWRAAHDDTHNQTLFFYQAIKRLEEQHSRAVETLRSEHQTASAATRAAMERAHAERTRAALAQLRAEAEQEQRNADRKLREVTTRFENLKEVLASKEAQFENAIAEAHSKADWDILQLRHLLDKADINYANNIENMTERYEKEKEQLLEEWSEKLKEVEEQAATAADEAKKLLESTRLKLIAERLDQMNKLKEQHRQEMDDQWEQFMIDKENCLARMKMECRQEGEEERVKREKELLEEIAELKSQIQSKGVDFDNLAVKAAACGRTLAVTEQELSCSTFGTILAVIGGCALTGSLRLALAEKWLKPTPDGVTPTSYLRLEGIITTTSGDE